MSPGHGVGTGGDDRAQPLLHLAALTDREASIDFLRQAAARGFSVSVDLQGFVRQADPATGEVLYRDVPRKREIVNAVDKVKLDALEAGFLTGRASPEEAAVEMESWGAQETMITWSGGVLVRARGRTYVERFSNAGIEGRTGRGDTTFGAYLACRLDCGVSESLRWAAAVASIKLELPGLFAGTKEQVRARLEAVRR
jgi:sugar/nucleoside kinase (ribokinase family)